ncbi:hypothetical protein DLJ53_21810 [Acuticoccus sediminis]|uniref:Uncharacterized protein n=1 Tax=Acuticoccus sediminis TaxID=2184697 RepID=A0A8B2NIH3_9HYPH|nr:hypothetical protein [Acuticoccus sediminis]RAH99185.1 hypothetical protein DLJ53_21810 [Acuticoccus sediminis]
MQVVQQNIELYRDNDRSIVFELQDGAGDPYDATGVTFHASVFTKPDRRDASRILLRQLVAAAGPTTEIAWEVSADRSIMFATQETLYYRLDRMRSDGKRKTWVAGALRLLSAPSPMGDETAFVLQVNDGDEVTVLAVNDTSGARLAAELARDQAQAAKLAAENARDVALGTEVGTLSLRVDDLESETSDLSDIRGSVATSAMFALANVAGTGEAYTADTVETSATAPSIVVFTPHATNTLAGPTLSVNGGPAYPIGESGSDLLGVGRLLAGYPYILRRVGGAWRLLTDKWLKNQIDAEATARGAGDADLLARMVARTDYADTAAFLADTADRAFGYVAGALFQNRGGVATQLTLDALGRLRNNRILVLQDISGTGAAYTATHPDGSFADDDDRVAIFTPHATNTLAGPTLSVNGGPAFPIGESGSDLLGVGRLLAGYPYVLRRVGGAWRLLTDKWLKNQIDAEAAARNQALAVAEDNAVQQARWDAISRGQWLNNLNEGGRDDAPILVLNPADGAEYWIATSGDLDQIITVSNDQFIDARHLKSGAARPVTIQTYGASSASVIVDGASHLVNANSLVQLYRSAQGNYYFQAIHGSVTLDGGSPAPTCDYTLITAGEALAQRFTNGASLYGFQFGWRDLAGTEETKFWFVNGANSRSGLVPFANAANYWWDPVNDAPGPSALAWKAALDAIPVDQSAPAAILWIFGQTDTGAIGGAPTMSLAAYKSTLLKVLEWMQDQIDPLAPTPVILSPVGAWDDPNDTGAQAVRWVELELIAENAAFHLGPAYFDLPRGWQDIHLSKAGQRLFGCRMAAVLDNVLNAGSNTTGPEVVGIEELDAGKKFRLTISGGEFTRPLDPEGFALYQSGNDPTVHATLNVVSAVWEDAGGGSYTLTLECGNPQPGATVTFPAGACTWARRGRWPMAVNHSPQAHGYGNLWPLKPFKSGAF